MPEIIPKSHSIRDVSPNIFKLLDRKRQKKHEMLLADGQGYTLNEPVHDCSLKWETLGEIALLRVLLERPVSLWRMNRIWLICWSFSNIHKTHKTHQLVTNPCGTSIGLGFLHFSGQELTDVWLLSRLLQFATVGLFGVCQLAVLHPIASTFRD